MHWKRASSPVEAGTAAEGYSSWGRKKSDTAERLSTAQHNQFELNDMQCYIEIDKVENPEYRESM